MFEIGNIVLVNENVRKPRHKYFGKIGTIALPLGKVGGQRQNRYIVIIEGEDENKPISFLEDELELLV